jgi:hypothetical protein
MNGVSATTLIYGSGSAISICRHFGNQCFRSPDLIVAVAQLRRPAIELGSGPLETKIEASPHCAAHSPDQADLDANAFLGQTWIAGICRQQASY